MYVIDREIYAARRSWP